MTPASSKHLQSSPNWLAPFGMLFTAIWLIGLWLTGEGAVLGMLHVVMAALVASVVVLPPPSAVGWRQTVSAARGIGYIVILGALSVGHGGFDGGITPWIAVFPLLVLLHANRVSARIVFATCLLTAVVMVPATLALHPDAGRLDVTLQAFGTFSATLIAYAAALRGERQRDRLHAQVSVAARQAGMAEVAAGVLHNVGNALNGAKVSAALLSERSAGTVADRLERLSARLADGDLPAEALNAYVRQLAHLARTEQSARTEETGNLAKRLAHIEHVVHAQQSHARSNGLVESVDLDETARQAVAIVGGHGIDYRLDTGRHPEVMGEHHKVLQVVTNLVHNARDAVHASGKRTVRITTGFDAVAVWLDVIDDGIGIAPSNLPRVFEYGFTTKPDGHGFGLHASALCASELGGTLTAHSEGPHTGARFRLTLPRT